MKIWPRNSKFSGTFSFGAKIRILTSIKTLVVFLICCFKITTKSTKIFPPIPTKTITAKMIGTIMEIHLCSKTCSQWSFILTRNFWMVVLPLGLEPLKESSNMSTKRLWLRAQRSISLAILIRPTLELKWPPRPRRPPASKQPRKSIALLFLSAAADITRRAHCGKILILLV